MSLGRCGFRFFWPLGFRLSAVCGVGLRGLAKGFGGFRSALEGLGFPFYRVLEAPWGFGGLQGELSV